MVRQLLGDLARRARDSAPRMVVKDYLAAGDPRGA
jgi:hypothetical protein